METIKMEGGHNTYDEPIWWKGKFHFTGRIEKKMEERIGQHKNL